MNAQRVRNNADGSTDVKTTRQDVAKHAKRSCRTCSGQGWYTLISKRMEPSAGGVLKEFTYRDDKLCKCALKRFARHFAEELKKEQNMKVEMAVTP